MLLVNLSREKIILRGKGWVEELPYFDIERQFPVLLIDTIQRYDIREIWVINGPGSFTTLRLGCLTVNTLKQFGKQSLEIYSCSKLDIYRYAVEQWLLPELGVVFMGQKKNMWKMKKITDHRLQTTEKNLHSDSSSWMEWVNEMNEWSWRISWNTIHAWWECDIINQENLEIVWWQEYFIDPCEHMLLDSLEREKMVEWEFDGEDILLRYREKSLSLSLSDLWLQSVERLEPGYMMDPQIG